MLRWTPFDAEGAKFETDHFNMSSLKRIKDQADALIHLIFSCSILPQFAGISIGFIENRLNSS